MGFEAKPEILTMDVSPAIVPGAGPFETPSLTEMVETIATRSPKSGAEALRELRAAFPESSLPLRVAALNAFLRRQAGQAGSTP